MNIGSIENAFYSGAVNPILRRLIHNIDEFCPEDGSLVINSLKAFLGEKIELCNRCRKICEGLALPFYEVSSILLHMDRGFMRRQFIQDKYRGAWLKGFALTMKGVGKYGVQIPFTPAGPFEVVWNFTYKCNLRCKHCYENAGHRREELSTDDAKRVVDILSRIANIGIPAISFSGGEPLMREDFFEVASYARGKIPYISLATNGTMISRDIAAKLKDVGVEYVEISIDGASAEKHDWFRGVPGAFDRAVEGAHNCIREGIDTCVASVIHRENFDEMEKIIELAGEIDARFMHFNYVPTGRAKVHLELDLTPKERLHVLETIGSKILDLYLKSKEEELKL
ncbi:MAG: radical SAM protein, partial [Candidatus Bathyarchaeia archaeon]